MVNITKEKILLDTDIGSDIDDAVCLAYLLANPACELLGITTVTGELLNVLRWQAPYVSWLERMWRFTQVLKCLYLSAKPTASSPGRSPKKIYLTKKNSPQVKRSPR